ncbi:MAG: DUF3298 domain-containing protein [Bacteroidales bacterium]|nr:DUF3298 domain-containing protein [Bacteroidales bacterium]
MKKLFPLALLALIAIACGRTPATIEDLSIINVSDSLEVTPDIVSPDDEIAGTISISLEFLDGGMSARARKAVRDSIIVIALGDEFVGRTPAKAIESYIANFEENYVKEIEEFKANWGDDDFPSFTLNHSEDIYGEFISCENGLLCYRIFSSEYSGGAHGIYGEIYLNFDTKTGKLIRASDLFTEDGRETLDYMLKRELESEGHTFWTLSDTPEWLDGNFKIVRDTVEFIYNPYEVDCYAAGIISVCLPVSELAPLMKKNSN